MSVPVASILGLLDAVLPDILIAIRAHRQADPTTWPTVEQVTAAINVDGPAVVAQIDAWEASHPVGS